MFQQQQFRLAGDQPSAKFAQDAVVKASIVQR
jgi:hypothetical protein